MAFVTGTSVLLLIDLQSRLMPAIRDADVVLANALRLAEAARLLGVPVLATEQNPAGLGPNVPSIAEVSSRTLAKQHFDATREAAWPSFLPEARRDVVVAGCEAHVCVLQTVMGLRRLGHDVRLVRDAIGSRREDSRIAALERAASYGAESGTTEMMLFEWLGTCDHPRFRDVLRLVK